MQENRSKIIEKAKTIKLKNKNKENNSNTQFETIQ
jgi:hypothetical protein